jgi:pimeloyl-ACP methyl ester carboxylesterase
VRPFRIEVAESELEDLRARLRATRWADDFGNADWAYGVERGWLQEQTRYWADEFDWRAQEERMNRHPHQIADIDGIPVHFMHVAGDGPPLILTHGWPWTFWDYADVVDELAGDFELVVPSLPGYGFSTPLRTTGVHPRRIAQLWVELMRRLGHERFGAAGGDWGAIITAELGAHHAEHLTGAYLTMPVYPGIDMLALRRAEFGEDEAWMPARLKVAGRLTRSHSTVQSIDPQTLAYALVDSPAGTAAWLWERRAAWSDGGLEAFDRDFLCTTASIYWLTRSIGTSLRIYHEHFNRRWEPARIVAPTGVAVFPKELVLLPRAVAEERMDLRRWTLMERGGHFAAAEQPRAVAAELREFFLNGAIDRQADAR